MTRSPRQRIISRKKTSKSLGIASRILKFFIFTGKAIASTIIAQKIAKILVREVQRRLLLNPQFNAARKKKSPAKPGWTSERIDLDKFMLTVHKLYFNIRDVVRKYLSEMAAVPGQLEPFHVLRDAEKKHDRKQQKERINEFVTPSTQKISRDDQEVARANIDYLNEISATTKANSPELYNFVQSLTTKNANLINSKTKGY